MRVVVILLLLLICPIVSGCLGSSEKQTTVEGTFTNGMDSGEVWHSFDSDDGEKLTFSIVEIITCVRDDDDPTQPEETSCRPKDVVIQSTCSGGLGDYTTGVDVGISIGGAGLDCDHDLVGLYEEGYLNATWRLIIDIEEI